MKNKDRPLHHTIMDIGTCKHCNHWNDWHINNNRCEVLMNYPLFTTCKCPKWQSKMNMKMPFEPNPGWEWMEVDNKVFLVHWRNEYSGCFCESPEELKKHLDWECFSNLEYLEGLDYFKQR